MSHTRTVWSLVGHLETLLQEGETIGSTSAMASDASTTARTVVSVPSTRAGRVAVSACGGRKSCFWLHWPRLRVFSERNREVFNAAISRLPEQEPLHLPLQALGAPPQFRTADSVRGSLAGRQEEEHRDPEFEAASRFQARSCRDGDARGASRQPRHIARARRAANDNDTQRIPTSVDGGLALQA